MSANKLYYRPRRTRKRFLYLRSCNGFILVRLSKAGYRFRVNAEDGYRGSAVSCSVFLTTQMGRYGLQANHVSFKNRKNSKKWPIRRRHFLGVLKMRLWYVLLATGHVIIGIRSIFLKPMTKRSRIESARFPRRVKLQTSTLATNPFKRYNSMSIIVRPARLSALCPP